MQEDNPIKESIKWLKEFGFTEEEAKNICSAIRADNAEKLWRDAPEWIEWCAKIKHDYETVVKMAAMGIITVELGESINNLKVSLRKDEEEVVA